MLAAARVTRARERRHMPLTPFHVALQVSDSDWVDFNLYGHQLVCHLNPQLGPDGRLEAHFNAVDGHGVPVPHCGVVLETHQWQALAARLRRHSVEWVIEPCTRFAGTPGEQSTLFIRDPSGNALEFKSFRDIPRQLFAK